MPYDLTMIQGVLLDGVTYTRRDVVTSDDRQGANPTVTACKVGTLGTRTDNDTGVVNMSGGHGIITGNIVDLYWNLLGVQYARTGMTTTVATNAVTVDGGAGDVLPATTTSINVKVVHQEDQTITGDNVRAIVLVSAEYGHVTFLAANGTTIQATVELTEDDSGTNGRYMYTWFAGKGETNPLAGLTVGHIGFSHKSSTEDVDMLAEIRKN